MSKTRNWGEITIIVSEVKPWSEGLGNFLNRALQESVILLGLNDTCEELLISLAQVSVPLLLSARF